MGTWFLCVILTCENQIDKDMMKVRGLYSNLSSLPGFSQQTVTKSLTVTLQITHITQQKLSIFHAREGLLEWNGWNAVRMNR